MVRLRVISLTLLWSFFSYSQDDTSLFQTSDSEIFRASFYSNFFGANIKSISSSLNTYYTTKYYKGKKLDKPVHYELYGELSRELHGVRFKYTLIEDEPPEDIELIKMYHLHVTNLSKYEDVFQFDSLSGYWIDDTESQNTLDSLVKRDIELSSSIRENEIGIYFHSSSCKYYIISSKHCVRVKIKIPFSMTRKGKRYLRNYNYKIDQRELCETLLDYISFCDRSINSHYYENNWGLDVDCYNLYSL